MFLPEESADFRHGVAEEVEDRLRWCERPTSAKGGQTWGTLDVKISGGARSATYPAQGKVKVPAPATAAGAAHPLSPSAWKFGSYRILGGALAGTRGKPQTIANQLSAQRLREEMRMNLRRIKS
jgi:hypothetical protein